MSLLFTIPMPHGVKAPAIVLPLLLSLLRPRHRTEVVKGLSPSGLPQAGSTTNIQQLDIQTARNACWGPRHHEAALITGNRSLLFSG
jgi:hypothetical protein